MAVQPYLSLIVPAFNEARRISGTLAAMQSYLDARGLSHEIIVAADGDDGTADIVRDMMGEDGRLRLISNRERAGKGRGIREGVKLCHGQIIGFLDADYKTPIEELEKVLPWVDQSFDVVIGSRALADSRIEVHQPFYRRWGSRGFRSLMRMLTGLRNIGDTQCGFKFFRAAVARDLFTRQRIDGYMFDVEILYLAVRAGYSIKEVGVAWRDDGDSRLQLVSGNWRNLKDLFRIRFGSYPACAKEPSAIKKTIATDCIRAA